MSAKDLSIKQQQRKHSQQNENNSSPTKTTNKSNCDHPLKDFKYPACWEDDERMQVLLSTFRPRDLNPLGYDSKMRFWQQMIAEFCAHKCSALFCINEIKAGFKRNQLMPRCLDVVVLEMQRTKAVRSRVEYEYDPLNSWTGWAVNSIVWRPLSWSVHKFKSSIGLINENTDSWIEYVHLDTMQSLCKDLFDQVLHGHQGEVLHYDVVMEEAISVLQIHEECLPLCLKTLRYKQKIGLDYKADKNGNPSQQIHLVKIPSSTNPSIIVSETDRSKHNLQCTQASLLKELEKLENEIQENTIKAKECLKENKRNLAKTYLRKKHLLEDSHAKRSEALHNIEKLLVSVEEALSNGEVLDAYKIGSQALQHALSSSGLNYDNVDEVVNDVRETIETQKELQDIIAADVGVSTNDSDADEELNRELAELMSKPEEPKTSPKKSIQTIVQHVVGVPKSNDTLTSVNSNSNVNTVAPVSRITRELGKANSSTVTISLSMPEDDDNELLDMLNKLEVEDETPLNLSMKKKAGA